MPISTRFTERLGLAHPIVSAPMAFAGGGALAAAVTAAGGLGLIGGSYGDENFITREFAAAGNQKVGVGFITWSLARKPHLLQLSLEREPAAVMLSFGDPAPFAPAIKDAGALLICQAQTLAHAKEALAVGADIVIAQGSEAGGHGATRGLVTLTSEIADHLKREKPDALLLAAGGIADGRGLAAALMLGADGVLMGSRFWATQEALVHANHHAKALAATGDDTVRQTATDIARGYDWPKGFTARVLVNDFTKAWHGHEDELATVAPGRQAQYMADFMAGNPDAVGVFCGEAAGLIHDVPSARAIVERTVAEAEELLKAGARFVR